jgi:hypothetical protein
MSPAMIRANGRNSKGQVLVLGLSWENLTRLRAGDPIRFDGRPYGYDGEIYIFAGRDEVTMARMIVANNPDVKLHEDPDGQ